MLSGKLVQLIESHWDEITTRVIRQVRHDLEMTHISGLPEAELREWGHNILRNLGHWLSAANEQELAKRYEVLGRLRFEEAVPLHEAVRGVFMLKDQMIDFVQEQGLSKSSMDLYAEEELERRLNRFFDLLICHLVRGYEQALRQSARIEVRSAAGR